MALSKEAIEAKPKKPLNTYMRWRNEYIKDCPEGEDKKAFVKKGWDGLSEEDMNKLKKKVEKEMEKYKSDLEAWATKYKVDEDDLKRKRSASKGKKVEEEETKPVKSKGERKKKEESPAKKDKESDRKKSKNKK